MSKLTEDQLVIILEEIKKDLDFLRNQDKQPTGRDDAKLHLKVDQIISFLSRGGDASINANQNEAQENKRLLETILQKIQGLSLQAAPPKTEVRRDKTKTYLFAALGVCLALLVSLFFITRAYVKAKDFSDNYRIVRYISASKGNKLLDEDKRFQGNTKDSLLEKAKEWELKLEQLEKLGEGQKGSVMSDSAINKRLESIKKTQKAKP